MRVPWTLLLEGGVVLFTNVLRELCCKSVEDSVQCRRYDYLQAFFASTDPIFGELLQAV